MRMFLGAALVVSSVSLAHAQDLNALIDAQARAAAPGTVRVNYVQGASTEDDGRTDWNMPLDPTQCYTFSGVGGAGVKHLYLYLWDPNGKRVADNKPDQPMVVLNYCPQVGGMFHLQAKTGEGHGAYAVGIYAKPAPPKAAPLDLGAFCDQSALTQAPGAQRSSPHIVGMGDKTDFPVMMEPGTCYYLVGCGEPSTKGVYLYLWGPDGRRITESKSQTPLATIGHCTMFPGMHKAQAKIKGKGQYVVGVYAKKQQ